VEIYREIPALVRSATMRGTGAIKSGDAFLFTFRTCVQPALSFSLYGKFMGLITDLLKESPLKAEQLENISLVEQRMQEEKLAAIREIERLKTDLERVRTDLQQAQRLVRVLEQEVSEWRRQARPRGETSYQPEAEAGS
jgi:hypothetical protein